jgi:DNA helicase IV
VKKLPAFIAIVAVVLFYTQTGCTQSSEELKPVIEEIKSLKEGQEVIKRELQEIKKFFQVRSQRTVEFKEAVINIGDDPFRGDKSAKVTLVDFTDYQ